MQDSSSDEDEVLLMAHLYIKATKKRKRRWWVHTILQKRKKFGEYHRLVKELELDGERFQQYFRLTREQFAHILGIVGPHLQRQNTNWREALSPRERLAICLR